MALKAKLNDGQAPRRAQREARIALKRERREARELKRSGHTLPIEVTRGGASALIAINGMERPQDVPAVAPGVVPVPSERPARDAAPAQDGTAEAITPTAGDRGPGRAHERGSRETARSSRRERDVTEFLERREQLLGEVREEARERIARLGEGVPLRNGAPSDK